MNKILTIGVIALFYSNACAQYYYDRTKNPDKVNVTEKKVTRDFDKFFAASWNGNNPLANRNFIGQQSSLGTRLSFRKRLNDVDRLWAGADFGWAVYKQYIPYQTYQVSQTQSVSTDLYNYSYNLNLAAAIDYFVLPMDKIFTPYVGLGFGISNAKFSQYVNAYSPYSKTTWGFLLRGEIGALVGFKKNSSWRLKGAVSADYATNTSSDFGYKNFTNIGYQIGIVKMAW